MPYKELFITQFERKDYTYTIKLATFRVSGNEAQTLGLVQGSLASQALKIYREFGNKLVFDQPLAPTIDSAIIREEIQGLAPEWEHKKPYEIRSDLRDLENRFR